MKWIGQHIVDFIARFRSDVYLEGITTSTETDMLVVDSNNKVSKRAIDAITVDVSDFMTDGADNRILTATGADAMLAETYATFVNTGNVSTLSIISNQDTADLFKIATTTNGATTLTTVDDGGAAADFKIEADGDIALEAAGNDITVDTDNFVISSSTTFSPVIDVLSTSSNSGSGILKFNKQRVDDSPVDLDIIGMISWAGEDANGAENFYANITAQAEEVDAGDEAGRMTLSVSNNGAAREGLRLTGDKGTALEVDVAIANGAASTTTIAGNLTVTTGITIGAHTVNDIDITNEFVDSDEHLMTSKAINARIAAVAGGGKGFLQWYYYSANLSTTNAFYIEKWNDEFGVSSSINSQITDYNDTASSHWQVIRGSRIVPYDATVTKFLVNVENSGTDEDIDVALWKATPSVTSRSSSGVSTTIDHLCTLTYDFSSYSGSGTWTKSTTSFNATSLTQGEYLFVTLKRTSGTDGSNYHVHSTVTFDY